MKFNPFTLQLFYKHFHLWMQLKLLVTYKLKERMFLISMFEEVVVPEFQVYILVSDISCQILNITTLTYLEIEWCAPGFKPEHS